MARTYTYTPEKYQLLGLNWIPTRAFMLIPQLGYALENPTSLRILRMEIFALSIPNTLISVPLCHPTFLI